MEPSSLNQHPMLWKRQVFDDLDVSRVEDAASAWAMSVFSRKMHMILVRLASCNLVFSEVREE